MMRLASVLLVAVLLSTSVISGTFAKYTTQDSASDVARVAKWGVELQVVGNLYGDSYEDKIVLDNADNITVQSVDQATDLVAPGTENPNGFTFSLKGKPEVDGEVTTTMKIQNVFLKAGTYGVMIPVDAGVVNEANFDEFEDDLYCLYGKNYVKATQYEKRDYYTLEDYAEVAVDYYPVTYALAGSTTYATSYLPYKTDTLKEVAAKIAAQLNLTDKSSAEDKSKTIITYTGTKPFESNTDLATWKVDGLTLTWNWKFEGFEGNMEGDSAVWQNKADTILGLLENATEGVIVKKNEDGGYKEVVEYTDYCLDTQFSIDITATQVD